MQELTHLSLCSGIGGLDLAAEWAGFRTVAQCEIDDYASKVLAKNFKGVPNLHDIRTVTVGRVAELGIAPGTITVISAGFPCQPYSLAGKGKGDSDERDLWGEVARVLGELRPKWFVGENTPGLFARENQRYFRRVLNDLTALGYNVGWGIWGACDVGAPHKRDRVFIVAHSNGKRRNIHKQNGRAACEPLGKSETEALSGAGCLFGEVFDAHGGRRGTNAFTEHGACKSLDKSRGKTNLAEQIAHMQLFPTPTVSGNGNRKGSSPKAGDGLETFVKRYPTPIANEKIKGGKNQTGLSDIVGGKLNSTWVEWLMGFPLGWTDLGV